MIIVPQNNRKFLNEIEALSAILCFLISVYGAEISEIWSQHSALLGGAGLALRRDAELHDRNSE